MEKRYAVLITNEYEHDVEGEWIPGEVTRLQGIFDNKPLVFEAIEKVADELVEYLKQRGEEISGIENDHEGWMRKILVDHSYTFSLIRDDCYKVLEYEANRLDRIEL